MLSHRTGQYKPFVESQHLGRYCATRAFRRHCQTHPCLKGVRQVTMTVSILPLIIAAFRTEDLYCPAVPPTA